MTNDFWEWFPKAYRDGDIGDKPQFTKYNMEVAFAAGAAAEREAIAKKFEKEVSVWARRHALAIRARGQKMT